MANEIVFVHHPETMGAMNNGRLMNYHCLPYYRRKSIAAYEALWGRTFNSYYDVEDSMFWQVYYKPYIFWFLKLIQDIENKFALSSEVRNISWEFAYHIQVFECEEDDEAAVRCSSPVWFITMRDSCGEIVHKNWSVAIDEDGDLRLKRGKITEDNPLYNGLYIHDDTYERLCSVVRTHLQLLDWANNKKKTS